MNYKKKAIIFDLDGVLVDSAICHYQAWKLIADEFNIEFDEKRGELTRGVSRLESLMIVLNGYKVSDEQIEELMQKKNDLYIKLIDESGDELLLPGVKNFLSKLKGKGFKLAVASSSKNTPALLKQAGLDKGYFDAVADGNDIKNTKPDPEVFLLAAERIGISAEDSLVVEDAEAGIEGAKAAEMGTFGVGPVDLGICDIRTESIEKTDIKMILDYFDSQNKKSSDNKKKELTNEI